jgi:hypothetical protein
VSKVIFRAIYVFCLYFFICVFIFTVRLNEASTDIPWQTKDIAQHGLVKEKIDIKFNGSTSDGTQERIFSYIEYKKISPVKYRLIIHDISQPFVLILTEVFNEGWRIYPVNSLSVNNFNANKHSSNIIENKNLPNGVFYETFFSKSIDEVNHIKANDYANGWIIDAKLIGNNFPHAVIEKNGMHDMEILIEYMPQRIYIAGILVSFFTLAMSVLFLWLRSKKYSNKNRKY